MQRITRKMDMDKINSLLEKLAEQMNEMKDGQEEIKTEMKVGQEEMKTEMMKEIKSGQEELKKDIVSVKEEFSTFIQEKMNAMEDKVISVESKVLKMEESIDKKVRENIEKEFELRFGIEIKDHLDKVNDNEVEKCKEALEKVNKEIEGLKKQVSNGHEESKVSFMPSLATIKLSTFDGKTSWQVYKTQFTMVAEANGWNPRAKAFHLAASLRGDSADILETLSEEQRHDFQALSSALELRFGEKRTKEYSRLQLKSRYQKAGESLQELAADIQRLSHLAFSDCPVETRQDLALHHFIESVRDPETQKALRLADVKDIGSALVYAHKIEAAQQAARKDRHSIRAVSATDSDSDFVKQIEDLRREIRSLRERKGGRNTEIRCWTCGAAGHVSRNCPISRDGRNNLPPHQGN